MDIKKSLKYVDAQVEDLEKAIFVFENIVRPRYEVDKRILENLREQSLKLGTLMQKLETGEDVTKEEIYDSVPQQFR